MTDPKKWLRRVIRFGSSHAAITIPREIAESLDSGYVWVIQENGEIKIRKAFVE